jgi:hypothetical protein
VQLLIAKYKQLRHQTVWEPRLTAVSGTAAQRNPDSAVAMDAKIRIFRGALMIAVVCLGKIGFFEMLYRLV